MAKTLRVRTRAGWVTKPVADIEANRLLAEEVDDNFLAMEDENIGSDGSVTNVLSMSQAAYDAITTPDSTTLYVIV